MSKPFNLADAKAGHPVVTRDGQPATVFKFDARNASVYKHFGMVELGTEEVPEQWNDLGASWGTRNNNLVMAPISTIDGLPVYPGDMITVDGMDIAVRHNEPIDWANAKWPRAYPKTQMVNDELGIAYTAKIDTTVQGWKRVANAAIRHGIDNGYLLDPRDLEQRVSIKASSEELKRIISAPPRGNNYGCVIAPVRDVERERAIMRAGTETGFAWAHHDMPHVPPYPRSDAEIDDLIAKVK